MLDPLVSILIPTFQRKALLLEALESVWVDASYPFEILVGDNASSDGTLELCEEFFRRRAPKGLVHAAVLRQEKTLSMVQNWNALLETAHGKYVRLLCDDDALVEGAIARELAALGQNPDAALCASARIEILDQHFSLPTRASFGEKKFFASEPKVLSSEAALAAMVHQENIFGSPSAVLFRRELLAKFSVEYHYATDWAAWMQLAANYRSITLPEAGCCFRIHGGNLTSRFVWEGTDIEEVFSLRWRALRLLEQRAGKTLTRERIYLHLALWLKLSRRSVKLLLSGRLGSLPATVRRVFTAIQKK
jgi:glycosyltransferase involved in cell wall biosynthesis